LGKPPGEKDITDLAFGRAELFSHLCERATPVVPEEHHPFSNHNQNCRNRQSGYPSPHSRYENIQNAGGNYPKKNRMDELYGENGKAV
jgi:hypothetical protein